MLSWQSLHQALQALYLTVAAYFPPYFLGTLTSGAFGVFAGAWVSARVQSRKLAVEELRSIVSATTLCLSICNRSTALKRQQVRPMVDAYQSAQADYAQALAQRAAGQSVVFLLRTDLKTLPHLSMPTDLLVRGIFERIAIRGRALAAAVELSGAIDGLAQAIRWRNDFVVELQNAGPVPHKVMAEKYLGIKSDEGVTDERFKDNVEQISQLINDCIFFSQLLAQDLDAYGRRLRRRHTRRLMWGLPKQDDVDWSSGESTGLIPPSSDYEPWLKGFKAKPGRWIRWRTRLSQVTDRWRYPRVTRILVCTQTWLVLRFSAFAAWSQSWWKAQGAMRRLDELTRSELIALNWIAHHRNAKIAGSRYSDPFNRLAAKGFLIPTQDVFAKQRFQVNRRVYSKKKQIQKKLPDVYHHLSGNDDPPWQ